MKAVVQRVSDATVTVGGRVCGAVGKGLLVYLGVGRDDGPADIAWLAEKISFLRIFEDAEGKMNLSVRDVSGGVLVVSQFTLYADAKKGRRPSYSGAAEPAAANALYEDFKKEILKHAPTVSSGEFGASMDVRYTNNGPVTIILDTKDAL